MAKKQSRSIFRRERALAKKNEKIQEEVAQLKNKLEYQNFEIVNLNQSCERMAKRHEAERHRLITTISDLQASYDSLSRQLGEKRIDRLNLLKEKEALEESLKTTTGKVEKLTADRKNLLTVINLLLASINLE